MSVWSNIVTDTRSGTTTRKFKNTVFLFRRVLIQSVSSSGFDNRLNAIGHAYDDVLAVNLLNSLRTGRCCASQLI